MNIMVGVASRQGPQQNPLMHRLMESLQKHRPGVNMAVQIEVGEQYTGEDGAAETDLFQEGHFGGGVVVHLGAGKKWDRRQVKL